MPNIKSAIKRVEIIRARTLRNNQIKSALRTTIKKAEAAIGTSNTEEAGTKLRDAMKAIDKAVTKGILHKKTASRKKSRLMKRFNKQSG